MLTVIVFIAVKAQHAQQGSCNGSKKLTQYGLKLVGVKSGCMMIDCPFASGKIRNKANVDVIKRRHFSELFALGSELK